MTRNANKSKFTYNGRGIAFDGKGMLSYGNDLARNVVIFGVDNTYDLIPIIKKITF